MSDNLGYPDGIYQWIFKTAFIVHPTHIYTGFHYGMNSCGIMGLALYTTSLNYWINPLLNSRRRTIDMIVAKSTIAYHFYLSLYTTNRYLTTLPISVGSGLYFASIVLEKNKKYVKTAAIMHCLLHILVSIGASFTYRDYFLQNMST
jgi:hypothetical protein